MLPLANSNAKINDLMIMAFVNINQIAKQHSVLCNRFYSVTYLIIITQKHIDLTSFIVPKS